MNKDKNYNAKRKNKPVSFSLERDTDLLKYADSLPNFGEHIRISLGLEMLNTHKTAVFTRSVVDTLKEQGFTAITYANDQYNNHFTVNSYDFRFYRMEENIFLVFGLEYFLVKDEAEAVNKIKEIVND